MNIFRSEKRGMEKGRKEGKKEEEGGTGRAERKRQFVTIFLPFKRKKSWI